MNIAFTIATINYLAQAKTTANSFLKYHSDFVFFICLIGNKKDIPDPDFFSNLTIIDTATTEIPEFEDMRSRYTNFELSCALKPFFADVLIREWKADNVIYFDSDILIFNRAVDLIDRLREYSIVLTPHIIEYQRDGKEEEMERMFLQYGLYNGGFFAVRKSKEGQALLDWWKQRLFTESYSDIVNGRYVDQIWMNLVPLFFEGVYILKNPGYNMAIWNLSERRISIDQGVYSVNREYPLVFYHFTQYQIQTPDILCTKLPLYTFDNRLDVKPLFEIYDSTLRQNNIEFYKTITVADLTKRENVKMKLSTFFIRVIKRLFE